MGKKTYFSRGKQKLSFALKVNGQDRNVSFSNFGGSYSTSDKDEQAQIESSWYFAKGHVYTLDDSEEVSSDTSSGNGNTNTGRVHVAVLDNVTTLQEAREVLKGSPYNIIAQKLNTPNSILAQAEGAGVSFPNLVV